MQYKEKGSTGCILAVCPCEPLCGRLKGWVGSCPNKGGRGEFGPVMGDKRAPAEAQRKRVQWEESEQRNERGFAHLGGNEGCGACKDEAQGRCEKKQEKEPGS